MAARTTNNEVSKRIVVVGSANQDVISNTDILPTLGETVMGNNFQTACGGKGANQAVAAACLQLTPVTMVCRVGNDLFGQNLLANFRRVGVHYDETATVLKNKTPTAVASIVVESKSGDNMIIVSPGANYELTKEAVRNAIQESKPSHVIVQLEIQPDVALEAIQMGKQMDAITILNTAPAPQGWSLNEFYPYIDILIPNETELQTIYKDSTGNDHLTDDITEEIMAKYFLEKGIGQAVIVTLGARGAMVVEKTTSERGDSTTTTTTFVEAPQDLPARKEPVVNTVGAGDSFCGALVSYYSTNRLTLPEAATYACGVASITVRKDGVQEACPTYEELPDCLKLDQAETSKRHKASKPAITFVTGNKNKLLEVEQILSGGGGEELPFEITNRKIDLPELQGEPVDIAKEKCRLAAKEINGAVLIEDTSLCFKALNDMPGPYIKSFLEKCGHDGLNRMLDGFDDRSAYAQTIVAFMAGPGATVHVFDGRTHGTIVQPRGPLDFGWDPIFEPEEGKGMTYAEMDKAFKNSISHRGRSFAKLRTYLIENASELELK